MNSGIKIIFTLGLALLLNVPVVQAQKKKKKANTELTEAQHQAFTDRFFDAQKEKMIGNLSNAEQKFLDCLKIDPTNGTVNYELAMINNGLEKPGTAAEFLNIALSADPSNLWYLALDAELNLKQNKLNDAVTSFQKLIEYHPDKYDFYFDLASTYFYLGDYKKALATLEKLEQFMGVNEDLLIQKLNLYRELGEVELAENELLKAIQDHPKEVKFLGLMADFQQQINNRSEAQKYFEKILELEPENGFALLAMFQYYNDQGQKEEARNAIISAFKSSDLNIDVKVNVLLDYYVITESDSTRLKEAHDLAELLTQVEPNEAKSFAIKGDFLLRDGKLYEARTSFREALKIDPNRSVIWNQVLSIDADLNDFEELEKDSEAALELFPTLPIFYYYSGFAKKQLQNIQGAIDIWNAGKTLIIEDPLLESQILGSLGQAYHELKKYKKSDQSFDESILIDPNNAFVLNNYSYYLSLRKERLDDAARMAKKANEISPDQSSFEDTYAWVLFQLNDYINAKLWIEKSISHSTNVSGEVLEHYGDILYKLGDTLKAIQMWKDARDKGSTTDLINQKIEYGKLVE